MNILRRTFQLWLVWSCIAVAVHALAAQPAAKEPFIPKEGLAGKDAVWVPSPFAAVEKMLDLAKVTSNDFVIDLGSGDGRNATFVQGDMFAADISQATVLALFLLPENLVRLTPKFLALRPGTRIVANTFGIEGWDADESARAGDDCVMWCSALLYIVPGRVTGTWRLPDGELTLTQNFQMVSGTLNSGGKSLSISNGRLRGDQIAFTAGGVDYTGRVIGDTIEGNIKGRATGAWTATRARQQDGS